MEIANAVEWALRESGLDEGDAFSKASEAFVRDVLKHLQNMDGRRLRFAFDVATPNLLVGKGRILSSDSEATREIRKRLHLETDLLTAIVALGWRYFEKICAGLMAQSGATESIAICSGDEGGIDIYGRIPIREVVDTPQTLIHGSLFEDPVLFLGQAKCYDPKKRLGRAEVTDFYGATTLCLRQYPTGAGPSKRVPKDFYHLDETSLRLLFTTADFTAQAHDAAKDTDITLVSGRRVAQFLIHSGIGITREGSAFQVDDAELMSWADKWEPKAKAA